MAIPIAMAVAVSLVVAGVASGSHERLIKRDKAVGLFKMSDGSLQHAREVFGKPSRAVAKKSGCRVRWAAVGVLMRFAVSSKIAPNGECRDGVGVDQVDVRSRAWRTDRGLRVGDPARRVRRLYPNAQRIPGTNVWALHTQYVGDSVVATASAITQKRRVSVLRVARF